MKSLKPSMREKKRYLLIKGNNLKKNVEKSVLEFIGIHGMSKIGLRWISHDSAKKKGIISINREMLDFMRASFCISKEKIEVEKVSGTLKGLRR